MSFAEVLLDLPENYGAIYSLFYGDGYNLITGQYSPYDVNGNKRPLVRIELGNKVIPESTLNYILEFYNLYGSETGFRFKNWTDYTLNNVELTYCAHQILNLQIAKTYTVGNVSTYKAILKPVQGELQVYRDNSLLVEGVGYDLDYTTGVITTRDNYQGYIRVTGNYHLPVVFDYLSPTYIYHSYDDTLGEDLYTLNSLVLIEIPYEPVGAMAPPLTIPFISNVTFPAGSDPIGDFTFEETALSYNTDIEPLLVDIGVHQVALSALHTNGLPADYSAIFDVGSLKASAFVAATLLELRRLMPFGLRWFSPENVDKISSVIGSMLYGEAELYYAWALYLYAMEKEASPYTAKFESAQDWFKALMQRSVLGSDGLLRELMRLYTDYDYQQDSDYLEFLDNFYGINSSVDYVHPPSFSVYDLDNFDEETNTYNYTAANNTIDLSDSTRAFTEPQFYAVMFKIVDGEWTPREVPGFPVPLEAVPIGATIVDMETYLADPQEGLLVTDDDVVIYPLKDYFMRLRINLGSKFPSTLEWMTRNLMPAGLLVSYRVQTINTGVI